MWDKNSSKKSALMFNMTIPVIERELSGKIINLESQDDNNVAKLLDQKCAIDGLLIHNKGVYGLAHRVGYNYDWHTFTIRIEDSTSSCTEIDHLKSTGLKPKYHIQSYIKGDVVLSMAIAKTEDLVDYIEKYSPKIKTCSTSGDKFAIIDWTEFKAVGYKIKILRGNELCLT